MIYKIMNKQFHHNGNCLKITDMKTATEKMMSLESYYLRQPSVQ